MMASFWSLATLGCFIPLLSLVRGYYDLPPSRDLYGYDEFPIRGNPTNQHHGLSGSQRKTAGLYQDPLSAFTDEDLQLLEELVMGDAAQESLQDGIPARSDGQPLDQNFWQELHQATAETDHLAAEDRMSASDFLPKASDADVNSGDVGTSHLNQMKFLNPMQTAHNIRVAEESVEPVPTGTLKIQAAAPALTKTDAKLPFYCHPPNPCPKGKTSRADGCMEGMPDTAHFNQQWALKQMRDGKCACDEANMTPESCSVAAIDGGPVGSWSLIRNQRKTLTSKKGVNIHRLHKREVDNTQKSADPQGKSAGPIRNHYKVNPYLMGPKLPVVGKKSPPML